ncbi:DUF4870 domain-containing protein [Shouchella clausii]
MANEIIDYREYEPDGSERMLAMLLYVLSFPAPILAPLIIWLVKRDDSDFIDYHGKEYFNFLISFFIYGLVASVTMIILIGFLLAPLVGLLAIILTILAAIKAYQGEEYRIPLTIKFLR